MFYNYNIKLQTYQMDLVEMLSSLQKPKLKTRRFVILLRKTEVLLTKQNIRNLCRQALQLRMLVFLLKIHENLAFFLELGLL